VVGARTQPLLSCMTIARMKRESTPLDDATDKIADLILAVSASEFAATPNWVQATAMLASLLENMVSKSCHWSKAGHPSEVSPVPPKTVYTVDAARSLIDEWMDEAGAIEPDRTTCERKDGIGAPEMSVVKLPAAKIKRRANIFAFCQRNVKRVW
jgi:hypothetical protein